MNNTYVCNKANNGYKAGDFIISDKVENILSNKTGLRIQSDYYQFFHMVKNDTTTLPITEYEQLVNIQEELRIQKEINKSLASTVTVLEMEIIKLIDKQAAQAMKDK
jgi:hypothetical protein